MLLASAIPAALSAQIAFTPNTVHLTGTHGNPSCVVDMNGDHLDDVVRFNGTQLNIAYQLAGGGFTEQAFGNTVIIPSQSLCAGDLDGNGYNDLFIGSPTGNSFFKANATGTAYTEQALGAAIAARRGNLADINNDGQLDAFVCNESGTNRPFRNLGGGTMSVDATLLEQSVLVGGNFASVFFDFDNDGDADLYISKLAGTAPVGDPLRVNLLYRNNGDGTWTDVGAAAGVNDGALSWVSVAEDFDNDGDFDLFVCNHSSGNRFFQNNGDGTFSNIIATTGITAGALGSTEADAGDFDNDGWIDLFMEASNGIWRNNGDGTFSLVTIGSGEGGIGDLNNDGWLDIHLGNTIRYNNGGTNHWTRVELQGILSNRNGIGARVELHGAWGVQSREIRSGNGYSHMSSLQAHFGLGAATEIDSLVVLWPSGVRTVVEEPPVDQLHIVPEAECTLGPISIAVDGDTDLCLGENVTLTAPSGFAGYQWSNGEQTTSIIVDEAGSYSVAAYDLDGCASIASPVVVTVVASEVPVITILGEEIICGGNTVDLSSSIGNNAIWSNGGIGQVVSISESGDYTVTADGACGPATSDPVTITVNPQAAMAVGDDVTIPVPGTADLVATGENIKWYADEVGGTELAEGNAWTTPFLNVNTTYWAEANANYGGTLMDGGKPDNSGGGGQPSTGSHSLFTAWEPFTIETVRVYALGAGQRTIQLCDPAGVVLESVDVVLVDGEQVITLDFEVPIGVGLSVRCPQHNLFRNNAGVIYPYAIGTMGELTTSGFGTGFYYYFYDWKVRTSMTQCPALRDPVTVLIGNVGVYEAGKDDLRVYPSPASTFIRIEGVRAGEHITVYDAQGRSVLQPAAVDSDGAVVVGVEALAPGTYTVRVNGKGRDLVRRISIVR